MSFESNNNRNSDCGETGNGRNDASQSLQNEVHEERKKHDHDLPKPVTVERPHSYISVSPGRVVVPSDAKTVESKVGVSGTSILVPTLELQ